MGEGQSRGALRWLSSDWAGALGLRGEARAGNADTTVMTQRCRVRFSLSGMKETF